jgi:lipopolysaccharide/colanic/teichoic acid biosynthesis glycosyltransferase
MSGYARIGKRLTDLLLGSLLLVISVPAILLTTVAIPIVDRHPPLFRQTRIGRAGRTFTLYKFRTMRTASESGPFIAVPNDRRVTALGRFLRASSLDELPQLMNVLGGEMSLVGPRPEVPENARLYPSRFKDRLTVRPGLTGLAQIKGRNDLSFAEVLRYDLEYAARVSIRSDLMILLGTLKALFRRQGAY